jgi:hypothetical protein
MFRAAYSTAVQAIVAAAADPIRVSVPAGMPLAQSIITSLQFIMVSIGFMLMGWKSDEDLDQQDHFC